ncbi:tRNA (adenosine(37)-N6)-threonylcarbamoyltransferase complex dimerization subunit type 1 TsaB [Agitococcus lubricus]|uniref:tRNA threonylcarbamoyladenosine biosynthesis protein TsaB n=1 Tax=Agitococcus lubricus TaxID=1077255 RepID=A0A2T5IZ99_9GAMM|nr:tRNA (adenosine(37)-N6)-threonylcarbamoyltransferase complex dimerization subunit type 1 TsaB [Agitococcus lubricus]PTQ89344.1 tRNA threonylcarbamoyladenosine biosynthesis protein TsaB [Agitococcus lubricus]
MPILALETATEACSVAIILDNGDVLSRYEFSPRLQTQLLLPMVDELLAQSQLQPSQLTAIAYSRGPGSFTGVRIAAAAAQGLAFGWDMPVLAISSLQTLAQTVHRLTGQTAVVSLFDARMNEVYMGAYQSVQGLMQPVISEHVCSPHQLPALAIQEWYVAGSGAIYDELIQAQIPQAKFAIEHHPHAYDLAVLAQHAWRQGLAQAPELALPVYLRDSVWQKLPNKS